MQNRDEIYIREQQVHDDPNFDLNREKEVSIFYSGGVFERFYDEVFNIFGDLKGKLLLEIGCGEGRNILRFVKSGCIYRGFDISQLRVERSNEKILAYGITDRAKVIKSNAEKLEFPDRSFDRIFGEAILHHLDLDIALREIKRVLKKEGFAVFLEPRGDNPIINKFREKTPHLRTIDEHPLVSRDFNIMKKYFVLNEKNFYFISLASFIFRKYLKSEFLFKLSRAILVFVDSIIFKLFPFTTKYAWYTIIILSN